MRPRAPARATHGPGLLLAAVGLLGACGSRPQPGTEQAAVEPSAAAAPDPAPAAPDAAGSAPAAASAAAAEIGLDLRALPRGTPPSRINLFVLGQGEDLRDLAPPGASVEIRHIPGAGVLFPVFRAETAAEAVALCSRVVTAYLERAPRLPVVMSPAASLVTPCRTVEPPESEP